MEGDKDERKVYLLQDPIEPEKVSISHDRLHYLLERSRALRWARAIAATALVLFAITVAGMSYQRGVIQTLHNEIGKLQAEKERKPLAPPTQGNITIKPC